MWRSLIWHSQSQNMQHVNEGKPAGDVGGMQNKAFKKALQVQEVLVLTLLLIYDDPLGHTFLQFILIIDMVLNTLFLPFPVNSKLEVKVGSSGWRKAVRRRYSDSNKKGCQEMRQKSANSMAGYHWGKTGQSQWRSPLCYVLQLHMHPQCSQ